ncbi:hypothetical protein ACLB2K_022894 [Fragaria x ananassa]
MRNLFSTILTPATSPRRFLFFKLFLRRFLGSWRQGFGLGNIWSEGRRRIEGGEGEKDEEEEEEDAGGEEEDDVFLLSHNKSFSQKLFQVWAWVLGY